MLLEITRSNEEINKKSFAKIIFAPENSAMASAKHFD